MSRRVTVPTTRSSSSTTSTSSLAGSTTGTDASAHRAEVDRELGDVLAVGVGDRERRARGAGQVPRREAVHAPREEVAVLLARRGALVLDERGLDLAVADDEPRDEVAREVFLGTSERHPED